MSTKAIQEALRMLRDADGDSGANGGCIAAADEAEKELEAIRKACEALANNSIGDYVYDVRDRELKGWDGPRVTAWGSASQLITTIAKESK
jgi:hypothetical protein